MGKRFMMKLFLSFFLKKKVWRSLLAVWIWVGLGTASWAENYRVPASVVRQVSSVLGEPMLANERLPRRDSIQVLSQGGEPFIRFSLSHGDAGGAPTDTDPRHAAIFGFRERAEVRTEAELQPNSVYRIAFQVRFVAGFEGDDSTVFQAHSSRKPPLLLYFRDFGRTHLQAALMQGCLSTCGHNDQPEYQRHKSIFPRSAMFGRWHQVQIDMDTSNRGSMT
ncbi:MAG: hypothetical protein AAF709_01790, partial [Pseudomonadota bacterium]